MQSIVTLVAGAKFLGPEVAKCAGEANGVGHAYLRIVRVNDVGPMSRTADEALKCLLRGGLPDRDIFSALRNRVTVVEDALPELAPVSPVMTGPRSRWDGRIERLSNLIT